MAEARTGTETATFVMLLPDRPAHKHGAHRARRKELQRRRPLWREALDSIRNALMCSPEAAAIAGGLAALVGMTIGASS